MCQWYSQTIYDIANGDRIICVCAKDSDGNQIEMIDEDEKFINDTQADKIKTYLPYDLMEAFYKVNSKAVKLCFVNIISFILFSVITVTGLLNWLILPRGY